MISVEFKKLSTQNLELEIYGTLLWHDRSSERW